MWKPGADIFHLILISFKINIMPVSLSSVEQSGNNLVSLIFSPKLAENLTYC